MLNSNLVPISAKDILGDLGKVTYIPLIWYSPLKSLGNYAWSGRECEMVPVRKNGSNAHCLAYSMCTITEVEGRGWNRRERILRGQISIIRQWYTHCSSMWISTEQCIFTPRNLHEWLATVSVQGETLCSTLRICPNGNSTVDYILNLETELFIFPDTL